MNSIEALRTIKNNAPENLGPDGLQQLLRVLEQHPEIRAAAGGSEQVDAFLARAETAIAAQVAPPEVMVESEPKTSPAQKSRLKTPLVLFLGAGLGYLLATQIVPRVIPTAPPPVSKAPKTPEPPPVPTQKNLAVIHIGPEQTSATNETTYTIFEDSADFIQCDPEGRSELRVTTNEVYSGTHAIQITPFGRHRVLFERPLQIHEKPWLKNQFRFLRVAVRMDGPGTLNIELDHDAAMSAPLRFDIGPSIEGFGSAEPLSLMTQPEDWRVHTIDLFRDPGKISSSGITLSFIGEGQVTLDHVILGRTPEDLDAIPHAPDARATNERTLSSMAEKAFESARPALVKIDADGRMLNGILLQVGDRVGVFTLGSAILGSKKITLTFSDGSTRSGKTGGIYRNVNCGMITFDGASPVSTAASRLDRRLTTSTLYVAFGTGADSVPLEHAFIDYISRREIAVRTHTRADTFPLGAPIFNAAGDLAGLVSGRDMDRNLIFTRMSSRTDFLTAMLNSREVIGEWTEGGQPMLPLYFVREGGHLNVAYVYPGPDTQQAGIEVGDMLVKLNDKSVYEGQIIPKLLEQAAPGDRVSITIKRANEYHDRQLTLLRPFDIFAEIPAELQEELRSQRTYP